MALSQPLDVRPLGFLGYVHVMYTFLFVAFHLNHNSLIKYLIKI